MPAHITFSLFCNLSALVHHHIQTHSISIHLLSHFILSPLVKFKPPIDPKIPQLNFNQNLETFFHSISMACNAEIEISTSTNHHPIPHKNANRHRPISGSIPTPKPRTHSGNGGQDPNQRTISEIGRKKKESGKSKFGFGGLGCVSSSPVSAPEVIRTAADWEVRKKNKKKKVRRRSKGKKVVVVVGHSEGGLSADVCCVPGIGFAAGDALVDCVDSRRPAAPRTCHRQRSAATRLPMQYEDVALLDYGAAFSSVRVQPEVSDMSSGRQIHHLRRRTPGGLPEILMLESSAYSGRSFGSSDQFGGWRLDVDGMSYEELLALGDRIGHVGTGLREEEIHRCIRKTKQSALESLPLLLPDNKDWGCSICQEGFEGEDEIGKLECNHFYHMHCIKQWLLQKNACPVCKATAAASAQS